jgi:NTE family protein
MSVNLTVVCGGGGVWGVAWMTGLISGLADAGIDLRNAEAFIGTSAGSVISTQLTSAIPLERLYDRQVTPASQPREVAPEPGALQALSQLLTASWPTDSAKLQAICQLAKTARTIPAARRRADIAERLGLPNQAWPKTKLSITAVDVETLELSVFTAASGVALIDAVAASCAVPGVWPMAEINGRFYIDGGVWKTAENAHLAQGSKKVLILSPLGLIAGGALAGNSALKADIAALEANGSAVRLICADAASLQAMAGNPLNPATRQPAAEAGRRQASAVEAEIALLL